MNFKRLDILIDGLSRGGAETLLLSMLPTLKKKFDEITIYYLKGKEPFSYDFHNFAKLEPVSIWKLILFMIGNKNCTMLVSLYRPILIANVIIYFMGKRGNSIICHEHTSHEFYMQKTGVYKIIGVLYLYLIKNNLKNKKINYLVSNKETLNKYINLGIDENMVWLFPNSVLGNEMSKLSECRRGIVHRTKTREIHCFTLSRLDKIKQIDWVINAMVETSLWYPSNKFHLTICGIGPDEKRLRDIVTVSIQKIDNLKVEFKGFVPSIIDYLVSNDFYFLASRVEGYPLSLTEAAISGINCITTPSSHSIHDLKEHFPKIAVSAKMTPQSFTEEVKKGVEQFLTGAPLESRSPVDPYNTIEQNTDKLLLQMAQKLNILSK